MNRSDEIIVLALIMATQSTPPVTALSMGVRSSMERITQTEDPGTARDVELYAARGEVESFQIAVRSSREGMKITQISFSDLRDDADHVIPAADVMVWAEHYVQVNPGSPNGPGKNRPLGPGLYADALLPVDFAELSFVRTQPFWVDVNVPREAAPGTYQGSFTVSSDQTSASGNIRLKVWHFSLPLRPSLKSSFGLQGDLREAAQQELLKNKVAPAVANTSTERASIDQFGLAATGLGFWSGGNIGHCAMEPPPSVDQIRREIRKHQADVMLYNYSADEIDACADQTETLRSWARNLHQAGVLNLVTMTPSQNLFDDGAGAGRSAVDIWALLPVMHDRARDAVKAAQLKGDEVWSYNTLSQDSYSPKWLIDYAPVNFRIQPGFISQSLGMTGLLYWRADFWSAASWDAVNNFGTFGGYNAPGEGMLLYRLDALGIHGVAPSMRLKWIRDGVEDFEYVDLLKKQGLGDWALSVLSPVGRDWSNWSQDPAALESVRRQLGEQLDRAGRLSSN